jgi:hypothetical protein
MGILHGMCDTAALKVRGVKAKLVERRRNGDAALS